MQWDTIKEIKLLLLLLLLLLFVKPTSLMLSQLLFMSNPASQLEHLYISVLQTP